VSIKIISGGQTGADRAALEAARDLGLETGGWAPKNYMTENGPAYELGGHFGLLEHKSSAYPDRTYANVQISDGTVWFGNVGSAGYRCTIKAIEHFDKPWRINPSALELKAFIAQNDIRVLNVAGNRQSRNPEVVALVYRTLKEALSA
jgi:hypothetical protein